VVVSATQSHGGTVKKFDGDSTLVIYGAPKETQQSAYRAVLTALDPRARQEDIVLGAAVNLASRIEAFNKQYPEHGLLISKWTYEALGSHRSEFELVSLGKVDLRGKAEGVGIWAVKGQARVWTFPEMENR